MNIENPIVLKRTNGEVVIGKKYDKKDNFLEYQYRTVAKRVRGVKTNLTAMGKYYNIKHDYDKLHNALVDLQLNLKVWNKLKWEIDL